MKKVFGRRKLPQKFLDRLRRIIPPAQYDSVVATLDVPKPVTFRVNWINIDPHDVQRRLGVEKADIVQISWYPNAFILRTGTLRELQETGVCRNGEIYIQSLSSMLPVIVLDPQPGEYVLDLAAAPGSKTTQMAYHLKGQGGIVANDNNRKRLYRLQAVVAQQASGIVKCTLRHGAAFGRTHCDVFDRVLVDAPCSSEGRFLVSKPETYRYWSVRKIHEMVGKQRKLAWAGVQALKPGGVMVYATCTFAPEENEGVMDWLLVKCGDSIELEEVTLPIHNVLPGLTHWDGTQYLPAVKKTCRVLPSAVPEGFFVAKIRKRRES
jgi:16S rRNA (cytosine1407-C5)-methyltransferase